jgi:hypothetical protein
MRKFFIFVGIGLLPFWFAMAATLLVFLGPSDLSKYGIAVPWLILVSLPACGVTLLIASANLAHKNKDKATTRFFLLLLLVVGVICGVLLLRHEFSQSNFKQEEARAIEFVKSQGVVLLKGGGGTLPADVGVTKTHDGIPLRYEIGTLSGNAIVSVVRSSGGSTFHLDCVTRLSFAARDPRLAPCEQ